MDDDSCSKFIGSLTKYLQSLCHSYVDFESGVELVGHIYLNVDTAKKIDYVLNESVCKNGANVVKFTSNSYHAQPVEKKKEKEKETPKKMPPETSKNTPEKNKNDDDDVIIVGSEASRNRGSRQGQPGSGSRPTVSPSQVQRGQQRSIQSQAAGMFRHPRGPQPRMSVPRHSIGAYRPTYPLPNQAAMNRVRGPQPRGYPGVGAAYNPVAAGASSNRVDSMLVNNPYSSLQVRPPQAQGRRASDPVDTDVTFMREEYVPGNSQQNPRVGNQPGHNTSAAMGPNPLAGVRLPPPPPLQSQPQLHQGAPGQGPSPMDMMNQRFGYNQHQPSPQYMQGQQQQQFRGPIPQGVPSQAAHINPGQAPASGVSQPSMAYGLPPAGQQTVGGVTQNQPVPNAGAPGLDRVGVSSPQTMPGHGPPTSSATLPPSFLQNQPQVSSPASVSGGMPLPVTTHTIFDSSPPVSSQAASVGHPHASDAGSSNLLTAQSAASSLPSSTAMPVSSTAASFPQTTPGPGMAMGSQPSQMWGESKPLLQTGMGTYPPSTQSGNTLPSPVSGLGVPVTSIGQASAMRDNVGNIFDIFSQSQQVGSHPAQFQPASMLNFAEGEDRGAESAVTGGIGGNVAGGGEGGSSVAHETDFFSQLLDGNPATSGTDLAQPVGVFQAQSSITPAGGAPGNQLPSMSPLPATVATTESDVKVDPGQIGVAIATSVIQEAAEQDAHEMHETFLAPHAMAGQGSHHSGPEGYCLRSGSTSSASQGSPSPHQMGSESTLGETVKIESGIQQQTSDYESGWDSGSTSTEKISSPAHVSLRPLTIPLIPVDSSASKNPDSSRQSASPGQEEFAQEGRESDDESTMSGPEPDQDDDDPSYTPGRKYTAEKGGTKRPRGRPPGRGKKRKTDRDDREAEDHAQEEPPLLDMDVTAEVHPAPSFSPSIETDNAESGDSYYKPGTFVLVNTSKDSERASRTRPIHTPAEVIATPPGKDEGLYVHFLVASGGGLWRLPNAEHLVDHSLDPSDVIRTLSNASVKIVGSKVFYKFDDL